MVFTCQMHNLFFIYQFTKIIDVIFFLNFSEVFTPQKTCCKYNLFLTSTFPLTKNGALPTMMFVTSITKNGSILKKNVFILLKFNYLNKYY